jgi:hypothetical protein
MSSSSGDCPAPKWLLTSKRPSSLRRNFGDVCIQGVTSIVAQRFRPPSLCRATACIEAMA